MPFGGQTHVGPRNHVLGGVEIPTGRGSFGRCPVHWKALGVSATVYTAKRIIQCSITAGHAMRPFIRMLWSLVHNWIHTVYRDTIVEKRKLLRAIGLGVNFPRISFIGIGWKLILSCLTCRCLTMGAKKDTADPRANIPLIMPATAPPVPRGQYYYYYLPTVSRMTRDFGKIDIRYCRSDHYSGQSSRINESWSKMLLYRCSKTEMRWNKNIVSHSSPERNIQSFSTQNVG